MFDELAVEVIDYLGECSCEQSKFLKPIEFCWTNISLKSTLVIFMMATAAQLNAEFLAGSTMVVS